MGEVLEESRGCAEAEVVTGSRGGLEAQGQGPLGPEEPESRDLPTKQGLRESPKEPSTSEKS